MTHPETFKVTRSNGPRPAGKPDECFYCHEPVGKYHKAECPCRTRSVVLRYTVEIVENVKADWGVGSIEFHRNESSYCGSNLAGELNRFNESLEKRGKCLCGLVKCEFVREATLEDDGLIDAHGII